jgi:cytochrome c
MKYALLVITMIVLLSASPTPAADGNAALGARAFRACAACHSVEANRNMTGPSLAEVWNRKAGRLASFPRYSDAMKSSEVIWNDETLDAYLKNPAAFMPGNHMTFPGVPDEKMRSAIIAFLKQISSNQHAAQMPQEGMSAMQRAVPHLKTADAASRIKSITYCHDTFKVTTSDGETRDFWERNLRFKTDSSEDGPDQGAPAIVNAGMMGDRASVIFASPEEISRFIIRTC